jgi:tetratricopeptide (TPR) repeat protein
MPASPALIFSLLVAVAFSLSTWLQPRAEAWSGRPGDHLMQVLLGDGRQVLANHLFVQADVYFHNGYYPSIFDQQNAPTNTDHMAHGGQPEQADSAAGAGGQSGSSQPESGAGAEARREAEHEKAMSFQGPPRDWIDRFGRKFTINSHTHATGADSREVLPWLRLSAGLDPHRIETYTVASYWLRNRVGKPREAEQFLREGLAANPGSYPILIELGRLYYENLQDSTRARNVWEAALRYWERSEAKKDQPDLEAYAQITVRLAHLEEEQGNLARAVAWLEATLARNATPNPEALRSQVEELRARIASGSPGAPDPGK